MRGFWNSRYVDFWSLPHFLFGVVMAQVSRTFGVSALGVALAMVLVAVLWEVFETTANIPEEKSNGITDVVLSIVGFSVVLWLVPVFSHATETMIFYMYLALWALLNVGGFLSGGWRSWIQRR